MDTKQRNNYYAFADWAFVDKVLEFRDLQEARVKKRQDYKEYLIQWKAWFDKYLSENDTSDMPGSWSESEPLPIANVIVEGDAGCGKTYSLNTLMQGLPDGTVSSFAHKGTNAFLAYTMEQTLPGSMTHVMQNNTMCKMLKIRLSREHVKQHLDEINRNNELRQSYKRLLGLRSNNSEKATRCHFKLACKTMWPLV